ncbi:hypothetical protein D1872_315250 [compost metagenome]
MHYIPPGRFPFLQVAVPDLGVIVIRCVREHELPVQVFLDGFHKGVAHAYRQVGVRHLAHRLFDGNKIKHIGMPVVDHQHQGAAAASPLLDQAGCVAEQSAPGYGTAR